jgi:hypothetical protein
MKDRGRSTGDRIADHSASNRRESSEGDHAKQTKASRIGSASSHEREDHQANRIKRLNEPLEDFGVARRRSRE